MRIPTSAKPLSLTFCPVSTGTQSLRAAISSNGTGSHPMTTSRGARRQADRELGHGDERRELCDYSACVVLQVRGENAYLLDVLRDRLEYPDLRRKVIESSALALQP